MAIKYANAINLQLNQLQNAVIHPVSTDPLSPVAGQIWYNSTSGLLKYFDGDKKQIIQDADVSVIGSGNAVTSASTDGKTIFLTKGTTFLTSANVLNYGIIKGNTGSADASVNHDTITIKGATNTPITTTASNVAGSGQDTLIITHSDSGVTAGRYGQSSAVSTDAAFNVVDISVNATGHVIDITNRSVNFTDVYAPKSHTHGNITNDGKIGDTSGYALYTSTGGLIVASSLATSTITGENSDNIISSVTQDSKGQITVKKQNRTVTTTVPSSTSTDSSIPTSKAVWTAIANGIAQNDAMIYKGTYTATSSQTIDTTKFSVNPASDASATGYTYRVTGVTTTNKYFGTAIVENGDMIIVNTGNPGTTQANYNIIQTNINGVGPLLGQTPENGVNLDPSCSVITDGSKKLRTLDLSFSDNNASTSGTASTVVTSVTQNSFGELTVTKANLPSAGNTFAKVSIPTNSDSTATVSGAAAVTIEADSSVDTLTIASADRWIIVNGDTANDKVSIAHAVAGTGSEISGNEITGFNYDSSFVIIGVSADDRGHITGISKSKLPNKISNATDASYAQYIGTHTNHPAIGDASKPVFVNSNGAITACTATVGGVAKPVYMSSGRITACSSTVGSGTKPVYMSSGTITVSGSTVGSTSAPVYLNGGEISSVSIIDVTHGGTGANNLESEKILTGNGTSPIQATYSVTKQNSATGSVLTSSNTDSEIPTSKVVYNAITSSVSAKDAVITATAVANSSVNVAHSLGKNVIVSVYVTSTGEEVMCGITRASDKVILEFGALGDVPTTSGGITVCLHKCD